MRRLVLVGDHGIDDVVALAVAAGRADVTVAAVVAGPGNVAGERAWANAAGMAALLGLDVPVGRGSPTALAGPFPTRDPGPVHGVDGLGGSSSRLPAARVAPVDGLTLLGGEVVATGPLTDVARALDAGRPIERVTWMGGGFDGGNVTPAAEFNAWLDPEAADRVLAAPDVEVAMVPFDVTRRVRLDDHDLEALASGAPAARLCADLCRFRHDGGNALHDPVAVVAALEPQLLSWEQRTVRVDTTRSPARGATVIDRSSGRTGPVRVAVDIDADGVGRAIVAALLALA